MINMKLPLFLSLFTLLACSVAPELKEQETGIKGVWMLSQVTYPTGYSYALPDRNGYTRCKLYEADSTFYSVELLAIEGATFVIPQEVSKYSLLQDANDTLLVENGKFMVHFRFVNDSVYTVYNNLQQETWVKVNNMSVLRREEIKKIVRDNVNSRDVWAKNYVLSTTERELERTNRNMLFLVVFLGLFVVALLLYVYHVFGRNRKIKRELEIIKEQNAARPQPIVQAMLNVEQNFFTSDYYVLLYRRMENGEVFKECDWAELEEKLMAVYPEFSVRLRSLCHMSVHEYRVCMLLKIKVAPSLIATVLCKELSSISSTRSRLYTKVFGKKGSSKDWDTFISTL